MKNNSVKNMRADSLMASAELEMSMNGTQFYLCTITDGAGGKDSVLVSLLNVGQLGVRLADALYDIYADHFEVDRESFDVQLGPPEKSEARCWNIKFNVPSERISGEVDRLGGTILLSPMSIYN